MRACFFSRFLCCLWLFCTSVSVAAQDLEAPTKSAQFGASLFSGQQGGHASTLAIGSLNRPLNSGRTAQLDFGIGSYRDGYTSYVIGGRLSRPSASGHDLGIYADYVNISPEHTGRLGVETSYYFDNFTLDALIGFRTGTNVETKAFDEIDLTYYVNDMLKGSVGHRHTTRGNVGNLSIEFAPERLGGWRFFAEAEVGEDDNHSAFAGLRFFSKEKGSASLMERDRGGLRRVRAHRGIVDVTRCGTLPSKRSATFGLREMSVLCASDDALDDADAEELKVSKK